MAGLDEVVGLLDDLRDGGPLDRARAVGRATRVVGDLTPQERVALARTVAERTAPGMLSRLRADGYDVDPSQADAVMDLLSSLDADDLRSIADSLRDPQRRRDMLADVARAAGDAGAEVAGIDLPPPPLPADATGQATQPQTPDDPDLAALQRRLAETEAEIAAAEERLRRIETAPSPAVLEIEPDATASASGDAPAHDSAQDRQDTRTGDDPVADLLPPVPAVPPADVDDEDLGEDPDEHLDEHLVEFDSPLDFVVEEARQPAQRAPAPPEAGPAVAPPAVPRRAAAKPPADGDDVTVQRLRATPRAVDAMRMLRADPEGFFAMAPAVQRAALRAVPAGWARRRALDGLVRAGAVAPERAADLLTAVPEGMSRVWVAATMIEDDLLYPDQLDALIGPRHAGRLRRRYGLGG